jgi:hypothetical protein
MRKRQIRILLASALALATPLLFISTSGAGTAGAITGNTGKFESVCFYDHSAKDDPIVFPGQPGASHLHDFISNNTTNANTTLASLQAGSTNCMNTFDKAAYWAPTMLLGATINSMGMVVGGTPIHPSSVTVYYLSNGKNNTQPFPLGIKLIAGNSHATSPAQEHNVLWGCSTSAPTLPQAPKCGTSEHLHVRVNFADCWDGVHLDSVDHVSHVAYSVNGVCPAGFPVPVPQLSILLKYPYNDGTKVLMSSGPTYTQHADFFNAWDVNEMAKLTKICLDANVQCNRDTSF